MVVGVDLVDGIAASVDQNGDYRVAPYDFGAR